MTNPTVAEKFVNWITGVPMALFDATSSVFTAAGANATIGLVPKPGASASSPPLVLGDNGAWNNITSLVQFGPFTSIASSATGTTDISTVATVGVLITGNNAITSLGTGANLFKIVKFSGTLVLTQNATTLILPNNGNNITTTPGDTAIFLSDASGNWTCVSYQYVAGSSPVLLNTLIANNTATTLQDTTSLLLGFSAYELIFENLVGASNGLTAELQFHSNGSFQNTGYVDSYFAVTSGLASAISSSTTFIPISQAADTYNTAPGSLNGSVKIFNPANTTLRKHCTGTMSYIQNSGGSQGGQISGLLSGYWNGGTTAIDGFQFLFNSGNIVSGTIKVFGIP